MTNQERQKSLDKKKWFESEKQGKDMSGDMVYCEFCNYAKDKKCQATQDKRETTCLCSRAYNKMKRK